MKTLFRNVKNARFFKRLKKNYANVKGTSHYANIMEKLILNVL